MKSFSRTLTVTLAGMAVLLSGTANAVAQSLDYSTGKGPVESLANPASPGFIYGKGTANNGNKSVTFTALAVPVGGGVITQINVPVAFPEGQNTGPFTYTLGYSPTSKLKNGTYSHWVLVTISGPTTSYKIQEIDSVAIANGSTTGVTAWGTVSFTKNDNQTGAIQGTVNATVTNPYDAQTNPSGYNIVADGVVYPVLSTGGGVGTATLTYTKTMVDGKWNGEATGTVNIPGVPAGSYKVLITLPLRQGIDANKNQLVSTDWIAATVK
jgi:hypothetical protein